MNKDIQKSIYGKLFYRYQMTNILWLHVMKRNEYFNTKNENNYNKIKLKNVESGVNINKKIFYYFFTSGNYKSLEFKLFSISCFPKHLWFILISYIF